MARYKKLSGVAHNIMDHAVSGLGYIVNHVLDYCAHSNQKELCIDLLKKDPLPEAPTPLKLSAAAKHEKFLEILGQEGFEVSELAAAQLRFTVKGDPHEQDAQYFCECALRTMSGKVFTEKMDSKTYWIPRIEREDPFRLIKKLWGGG